MEQSNNHLRLNTPNQHDQKRISSLLHSNEKIIFCVDIWKYNKDGKCQQRILVLTNESLLNVVKNQNIFKSFMKKFVQFEDNYELKRRINLSALYGITIAPSRSSNVFLIHVINDHDYYYKAIKDKLSLLQMISEEYRKTTKKELAFFFREEMVMLNYCTFKNHLKQKKDLKPKQNPHFLKNQYFMERQFEDLQYICEYTTNQKSTNILPRNFMRVDVNQLKPGCRYFVLKQETNRSIHLTSFLQGPTILKPEYCFFSEKKELMFVPFMVGGCFKNYIDKYIPLSRQNVIFYMGQVIIILEKLRQRNKYLNNLSLSNLYVKNNGYLVLDGFQKFDQISNSNQNPQKTFKLSGNPHYFSPQEVTCQGKEKNINMWSLGVLSYYLWKGKYPFQGKNIKQIYFKILNDQVNEPQLPPFINELLQKDQRLRLTFQQLRNHKDFSQIKWKSLQQQQLKSPFVVNIQNWSGKLPIVYKLDV